MSSWSSIPRAEAIRDSSDTTAEDDSPGIHITQTPLPTRIDEDTSFGVILPDKDLPVDSISLTPVAAASDTAAPTADSFFQWIRANTHRSISFLSSLISANGLAHNTHPSAFVLRKEENSTQWVGSSNSWFNRKVCHWIGLCGAYHHRRIHDQVDEFHQSHHVTSEEENDGGSYISENWTKEESEVRQIPDYVLQYAPMVHLSSIEKFWPCDMGGHLHHITPYLNYTPIRPTWDHPTLQDLDELNTWKKGRFIFLTSNDDVESRPGWLGGEKNIPEPSSLGNEDLQRDQDVRFDDPPTDQRPIGGFSESNTGGRSDAPAVLIVVDKGDGVIDAFWFYFYSYNLGNEVFGIRFGNHVGDWEHSLVRFENGKPKAVFLSEHSFGEAFKYEAVEKIGQRPVIYSAEGTHAMYGTAGTHAYVLPWGLLYDRTDRGPLWDPALNFHAYTYDFDNDALRASNVTPHAPTEWFYFSGHWGDKSYPLEDKRQYRFAGQYHYVNGPLGPRFKNLGRRKVCQGPYDQPCVIRESIDYDVVPKRWVYVGEGEEMSEEDYLRFLAD